jgi:hypothetical protein
MYWTCKGEYEHLLKAHPDKPQQQSRRQYGAHKSTFQAGLQ